MITGLSRTQRIRLLQTEENCWNNILSTVSTEENVMPPYFTAYFFQKNERITKEVHLHCLRAIVGSIWRQTIPLLQIWRIASCKPLAQKWQLENEHFLEWAHTGRQTGQIWTRWITRWGMFSQYDNVDPLFTVIKEAFVKLQSQHLKQAYEQFTIWFKLQSQSVLDILNEYNYKIFVFT